MRMELAHACHLIFAPSATHSLSSFSEEDDPSFDALVFNRNVRRITHPFTS
jgi:hypothetical protein